MTSRTLQLDEAFADGITNDGCAKIARFTGCFAELRPVLMAFLMTRTGGDAGAAGDCLQEVALIIWKKSDTAWNAEDFRRYAFRCADIEARPHFPASVHSETSQAVEPVNIIRSEPSPEDTELIELVDRFLDQRLDENEGKRLAAMLRDDPAAMRYCAGRIRPHAELHSVSRPLMIEIHEDRDLVIEQAGGVPTVTAHQSNRVSVAQSGGSIASSGGKRPALRWWLIAPVVAVWWIVQSVAGSRMQRPSISAPSSKRLQLADL